MKKFALCGLSVLAFVLTGCSTKVPVDSSGREVTNTFEAFKKGEIRFTCRTSCSGAFGWNRPDMEKLYGEAAWLLLANQVIRVGFETDLSYFYLAKAADGLGHYEAAAQYYKAAAASGAHKCAGAINNCEGHVFPAELQAGIDSLPIDPSLKLLVEKKAPAPTAAKVDKPIVTSLVVKPTTAAIAASSPAGAESTLAGPKAVINGNGYPEITIQNLDQAKLTDVIKTDFIGDGWFIAEEGTNSFLAYKTMDPARKAGFEFSTKVLGHRRASSYKDGIYFLFANSESGTKVVARPIWIKSFDGDEVRNDQNDKEMTQQTARYLNMLPQKK